MWAAMLLLGSVLPTQADAAADEGLELKVRRLVLRLDADQLSQRQAAEEQLLGLGPEILDLLPQPTDRLSAEARQRIGRVRQKLQQLAAEAVARPSSITLRGDALPLSEVLAALGRQSGNKIVDFRDQFGQQPTDPPLEIDFKDVPFWEALDRVLDQAELEVYSFGEDKAISLVARSGPQRPRVGAACYSGPLRIEPIRLIARRELRGDDGSLRLMLSVIWEPRLRPINLRQKLSDVRAVDENGRPLPVEDVAPELNLPTGRTTSVQLVLPFALPPREVKQIASLEGKLAAMIPGKVETFTFDNLIGASNVEKRIAGVTVTLNKVRENRAVWQVLLRVRFDDPGGALASHFGWIDENEAYLEGPDGKPITDGGRELMGQDKDGIAVAYVFVLDGPPEKHKFIYKTPGVITATEFDYELKGINLP